MGKFKVVRPGFVGSRQYTRAGGVVDVPEAVAKPAVAAGVLEPGEAEKKPEPKPEPRPEPKKSEKPEDAAGQ